MLHILETNDPGGQFTMSAMSGRSGRYGDSPHQRAELERAWNDIENYFSRGLDQYGVSPQAVGSKDADAQRLRFDNLAYALNRPPNRPVTVNDFGCGYGALFSFLDNLTTIRLGKYYGYDVSASMLDAASEQTDARATFIRSHEITKDADYSFVSGTFNDKPTASSETWLRYVELMVEQLAAHSRIGFAFNLLSSYVDFQAPNLFYADPLHFFSYCKTYVSPYVTLLHDYPLYEWTIAVRMPVCDAESRRSDRRGSRS